MTRVVHPIAAELRALREKRGWSLEWAAIKTGFGSMRIGAYERGDRRVSLSGADTVAAAYGRRLALVPTDLTVEHLALASRLAEERLTEAELDAALAIVRVLREQQPALRSVA
jgi:transcriptional regulator with XRE-family HTH domain